MKKILLYIVLSFCTIQQFHSQESQEDGVIAFNLPVRNSLKFNQYAINPTFSFVREQNKYISFSNKREWVQFDDAPQTYLLSYSGRFTENAGMGIGLFQQNYGVLTTFGGVVNYAYNAVLNTDNNLTFGINLGFYKSGLSEGSVVTNSQDPSLQNIPSNMVATINPGINYGTAFFDFGLSVNNLFSYNFKTSKLIENNPEQSVQAHIMYTGYMNNRGFFDESKFSTLIRSEFKKDNTIISGIAMLNIPKGIWAQAGYNTLYGLSAGIGLNVSSQIAIEYNYEKAMGDLSNFGNSHDITLAFKFKNTDRYNYSGEDEEAAFIISDKKSKPSVAKRNTNKTKIDRKAIAEAKAVAKEEAAEQTRTKVEEEARLKLAQESKAQGDAQSKLEAAAKIKEEKETKLKLAQEAKAEADAQIQAKLAAQAQAKAKADSEAKAKLKLEAQAKLAEAARIKAKADAQAKLEAAAKLKAAEDAKLKLAQVAKAKADAEIQAKLAAQAQAKAKADAEAKAKLKLEAQAKLAEAAKIKSKADAQAKLEAAAKLKAAEDAKLKLAQEAKAKADAEIQAKLAAQAQAQAKADAEEKAKLELEAQDKLAEAKAVEEAQAKLAEAAKVKAKADAQAKLEAAAKLKAAEDAKLKLAQEAKVKADAEIQAKLAAQAQAKAKADAEAKAKLELETQAKIAEAKAEEEAQAKLAEAARIKAKAEAQAQAVLIPTDATAKSMQTLAKSTEASKKVQQELLTQLNATVASKEQDLEDLKEENDLSEQGIFKAPKAFKSISAENAALESLKSEIDDVIKSQDIKISDLEKLYNERLKEVTNKNDAVNASYLKTIQELKSVQLQAIQSKENLVSTLIDLKVATEVERKRRIKRAAYDNEQDRYLKDRAVLKKIQQFTPESTVPLKETDFDFGEEQSKNIQIVKSVKNTESGYYLVLAVHSDVAKRDEFLAKAVSLGLSNINFFYDVNTNKYFIYYEKFDDIPSAEQALRSKGNAPYNSKQSMVKVEN